MPPDHITEHRRLAILRHLSDVSEYTSNGSILIDIMRGLGIATTDGDMTSALIWLDDNDLIERVDHGHVVIATATARGIDVAKGIVTYPGVQRPRPRS